MMKTIEKECKKHGFTTFVIREINTKKRYRCRKCSVDAVTKRRKVVKLKAVQYKGGCCEICGYDKSVWAMQFHHKEKETKDFNIGYKGNCKSWESVKKELDKCILVCSNCHAEIHEEIGFN